MHPERGCRGLFSVNGNTAIALAPCNTIVYENTAGKQEE